MRRPVAALCRRRSHHAALTLTLTLPDPRPLPSRRLPLRPTRVAEMVPIRRRRLGAPLTESRDPLFRRSRANPTQDPLPIRLIVGQRLLTVARLANARMPQPF
jgi:hypothetical protein